MPSAFKIFDQDGMTFNASAISGNDFILGISDVRDPSLSDETFASNSHAVFNLYIVALNVCTLGLFLAQDRKYLSPPYRFINTEKKQASGGIVVQESFDEDLSDQVIDQNQIIESLWLYGALANEKTDELVSEYLKGLIHLSLNYPGTHFEKDAFSNFYRTFEHLVTNRLLGKKEIEK
jgi:hypothetical protein